MKTCVALLTLLLLLTSSAAWAGTVSVPAEQTTTVVVSSRNVNRISCASPIQDVIWSKEQPIEVTTKERNLFAKFLIKRTGEGEHYADTAVDLHIVCNNEIYTLILQPREVDTVTVQLGDPALQQARDTLAGWASLPLEAQIKRLTLAVYKDELPQAASRAAAQLIPNLWVDATPHDAQRIRLPGIGLAALTFELTTHSPVTLNEHDFLIGELSPSILAGLLGRLFEAGALTEWEQQEGEQR